MNDQERQRAWEKHIDDLIESGDPAFDLLIGRLIYGTDDLETARAAFRRSMIEMGPIDGWQPESETDNG